MDHHIPRDDSPYILSIVHQKSPSTTYMIWKYFEYLDSVFEVRSLLKVPNSNQEKLVKLDLQNMIQ